MDVRIAYIPKTRCLPAERAALEALARRDLVKRADVIRAAIREAAARAGLWPPPAEQQEAEQ